MAEDYKEFEGGFYTKGAILEVGTFTPGSSKSGESVSISESDLEELYNNIKGPVPFTIGHGDFAPTIGHASKFRKNGNRIEHKGIVSDPNLFTLEQTKSDKADIKRNAIIHFENTGFRNRQFKTAAIKKSTIKQGIRSHARKPQRTGLTAQSSHPL